MMLSANTEKLIINSFANGELDRVMELHAKIGKPIFDFIPRSRTDRRVIFFAFKHGHFNIVKYYISYSYATPLSKSEVSDVASNISGTKLVKWLNGYNTLLKENPKLEEFIKFEDMSSRIMSRLVGSRNENMIDFFISRFPETLLEFIELCGNTPKGRQLKRELQLKELFK